MAERRPHMPCREVVELVTDYLERALHPLDAALVEQHLNFCDGCVAHVEQMRTTVRAVGGLRAEDVPTETRTALLAAFREWRPS